MSAPMVRIASVDFGATKILVQVLGYRRQNQFGGEYPPYVEITTEERIDTTKGPNNPEEDYLRLYEVLERLQAECGFDGISVGIAARLDKLGVVAKGGSLRWEGRNLARMLTKDFNVPAIVDNDGAMLAAVEIVFGVLNQPEHQGKSGLIVAPGTGIAVCLFVQQGGRTVIYPGEGAHMVIDTTAKVSSDPTKVCGCGRPCVESMASGGAYERAGINPALLSEAAIVANLAPAYGTMIANYTKFLPSQVEVIVMSGGISHKRPTLVAVTEATTTAELNGYVPTPEFFLSQYETGGVLGSLARWMLSDHY